MRQAPDDDRDLRLVRRCADGILIELATDGPGFLVDEPPITLGQALSLPRWLEPERATLERELTPIG